MIKTSIWKLPLLLLLFTSSCKSEITAETQTCNFRFTVLGYSEVDVGVYANGSKIYNEFTTTPEIATELSAATSFNLDVPTELKVKIDNRLKYKIKIRDCEKRGIIVSMKASDIRLISLDNYFFE